MADFVLLYRGGSTPESDAERAAVMQDWTSWFGALGAAVKDGGNPFTETAKAISPDGSIGDVSAQGIVTGYSIIEADSQDTALTLAKDCPVLRSGGEVHVYETMPVM